MIAFSLGNCPIRTISYVGVIVQFVRKRNFSVVFGVTPRNLKNAII
jgi:hypothetical protein